MLLWDLHVDDGYIDRTCGEDDASVDAYLEGVFVQKLSSIIGVGDSFEHV